MPIRILKYVTVAREVWQQERFGRRFVARCASKAKATRIARLLNEDLEKRGEGRNKAGGAR